jgi:hypothetical protein
MAHVHTYEPLAPVYTASNEREIELGDLPASVPVPAPVCEAQTSACCSKDGKKRSVGARICRCLAATVVVGLVLWLVTGAAFVTYFGAKAHRCLHPRHTGVREFTWTPAEVPTLELGLVAGGISVRSCPHAKNVSLVVRTYAANPDLLNTMVLERAPLAGPQTPGQRIVLAAPSFDWAHCQRASMELVVPEGAKIDVKLQGILAHLDVRADKEALRHVVISATAASIDVQRSHLAGMLRVESEVAHMRVRDVSATEGVVADVRIGSMELRSVDAGTAAIATTLRIGKACLSHITAASLSHQSELAYFGAWDVSVQNLTARVDTGSLNVGASQDFSGSFAVRSPFGFVSVRHGDQVSGLVLSKETLAVIEGSHLNAAAAKPVLNGRMLPPAHMELDAVYGSVDLFVPNPETAHERSRHH